MIFSNKNIEKIYKFIYIHDKQTILIKDICSGTGISKPTVIKHIKWLQRRELIKRDGKHFSILPPP